MIMDIKEVFKRYPENEPNYNGINYLTLVDVNGVICYDITYFNNDCNFESDIGTVVAFTDMSPSKILNSI